MISRPPWMENAQVDIRFRYMLRICENTQKEARIVGDALLKSQNQAEHRPPKSSSWHAGPHRLPEFLCNMGGSPEAAKKGRLPAVLPPQGLTRLCINHA